MLNLESATSTAITAENTGNSAVTLNLDANRSGADQGLGNINFKWNGTAVAQISGASGADTTNKDDGQIQFSTMSGGSSSVNMTLDKDGKLGLGTSSIDSDSSLHIKGTGDVGIFFEDDDDNQDWRLYASNVMQFYDVTNSREMLRLGTVEAVFNEGGADLDFRIEGDTNSNLFTVDAGTERIGIGSSPERLFHVKDSSDMYARFEGDYPNIELKRTSATSNASPISIIRFYNNTDEIGRISTWDASDADSGHMKFGVAKDGTLNEPLQIIDSKIGIGTASPDNKVSIEDSGDTIMNIDSYSTTFTNVPVFKFRKSRNDTTGTITQTTDTHLLGFLGFEGVNSSSAFSRGAAIFATQNGASGSSVPAKLSFQANSSSGSSTAMVLDENSRISLSNNDGGTSNTVFGHLAGDDLATGGNYNTFIGQNAGHENKLGDQNIAIGFQAMDASYIDDTQDAATVQNVFIGNNAGGGTWVTTACHSNTAIGAGVMAGAMNGATNNTAVGLVSSAAITTGDFNSGLGAYSNYNVTTGEGNTSIGYSANLYNETGTYNTFLGTLAGQGATGQSHIGNTGLGYKSLFAITTGDYNSVAGYEAADALTTGQENVVMGRNAMGAATTQSSCTLIGVNAGANINNNDANGTVAVGINALTSLTEGQYNVAVGTNCLEQLTTGDKNVALGYQALDAEDAGSHSIAIGYQSLTAQNNDNGMNTAVGNSTGYQITSGHSNTLIGSGAGATLQSGYQNTLIGRDADATSGKINATAVGYGTIAQADDSVTLGNASVSAVYMASDSGATVHCAGINFPDTQVASADANTLDDYEEGTWTPAFVSGSGHAPSSITVTRAVYTKIGNVVTLEGNIGFDDSGGGGDPFILENVPFNFATNSFPTGVANFRFTAFSESTMIYALGNTGTNQLTFYYNDGNGDRAFVSYTNTDVASNTLTFTITYLI
jgi:hypothetical protein